MLPAITVLAIETSCDETSVAVVRKAPSAKAPVGQDRVEVLSHRVASQMDIHAVTGGVIPDVAAREHVKVFPVLLKATFAESFGGLKEVKQEIDAIAVTVGPGLQPALAVGVNAARALSYAWDKPLVPVHHIEGHLYSALQAPSLTREGGGGFPILALIVSGGHTQLIVMKGHLNYEVIGSTVDDAVGEAFDKVARLLELPYPGGPQISKLAEQGNDTAFQFPRPMQHSKDLNFSFSGLKTAVLYKIREMDPPTLKLRRADLAAGFQRAAIDSLLAKTKQAIDKIQPKILLVAGGVAANKVLRKDLEELAKQEQIQFRSAPLELCGDNALMIGLGGVRAFEAGRTTPWAQVQPQARVSLESLAGELA